MRMDKSIASPAVNGAGGTEPRSSYTSPEVRAQEA